MILKCVSSLKPSGQYNTRDQIYYVLNVMHNGVRNYEPWEEKHLKTLSKPHLLLQVLSLKRFSPLKQIQQTLHEPHSRNHLGL